MEQHDPELVIHPSQCTDVETGLRTLLRIHKLLTYLSVHNITKLVETLPKIHMYTSKLRMCCVEEQMRFDEFILDHYPPGLYRDDMSSKVLDGNVLPRCLRNITTMATRTDEITEHVQRNFLSTPVVDPNYVSIVTAVYIDVCRNIERQLELWQRIKAKEQRELSMLAYEKCLFEREQLFMNPTSTSDIVWP